jgi:hypothetical protein
LKHLSRRDYAQFPNLFLLARDILTIPGTTFGVQCCFFGRLLLVGSAVAVERIFSGGRDTISLRRVSLMPETIRTVKQRLRMACMAVKDMIGGA